MTNVVRASGEAITNDFPDAVTSSQSGTKRALDVQVVGGADINVDANSVDTSGLVGKSSGGDFTTAWASATTITIGGLPSYHSIFIADDVISVVQIAADGSVTETYHRDDVIMTVAGNVLTVTGATFLNTDTFVIYTNIPRISAGSSGGSAGGGNNTYSTEQGDFTAIITDATNNVVLSTDSLAGSAITEANLANAILKVWDASTEEMVTITLDDFTWTPGTKTIDTTNCTGAFTFATGDLVSLTLSGPRIQDNRSADAKKNIEQAPIYTHNIGDTLAEVTNETNATNNYYLDVSGYDELYFDFEGVAGTDTITLTLEASAQDDGTVDSSCSYTDISQYGISPTTQAAGAASYTADLSGEIDCKGKKYIKFKTVSSGGSNDGDYNLRVGRAY